MGLEKPKTVADSWLSADVKKLLLGIIEEITPGFEEYNLFSEQTKQPIGVALTVDPSEVASYLANDRWSKKPESVEDRIREYLKGRIIGEVAPTLVGAEGDKEREGLMLFIEHKVMNFNPRVEYERH